MSKIILKAFDARSKWAYIEENNHLYLIRPPFGMDNKVIASEQNLSDALQKMFYTPSDKVFRSSYNIIDFLKKNAKTQTRTYTKEEGEAIDKRYLIGLHKAVLKRFLNKLEAKIPEGDTKHLLKLLDIISQNRALQKEKELQDKVADLQTRLQQKVACEKQTMAQIFSLTAKKVTTKIINVDFRSIQKYGTS